MADMIEAVWADFRARLKPRTVIKNWSMTGRAHGQFSVVDVDGAAVTVLPKSGEERRVSKGDFEKLLKYWEPYSQTGSAEPSLQINRKTRPTS
jgi:hypothetical protein